MPSDASFAPGVQMTVLGVAHGAALEPGDDVWYRVSTGSYRAAFIYSAYLKFAHPGVSPVPLPLVGAAAALAVDMDSLRILYSRNATVPRPPASLVKMMTAAVALDHFRPNTVITVPRGALSVGAVVGGSAMGLLPGERLSLRDLLYGLLLPSGNDAAYTVAQAVAGSQQAFAALMNAKATALGLLGTHFAQSYGFDEADQYSTAWDLMRLARYDLRHYALFDRIVATAYRYIGPGRTHPDFALHNQNRLLGVYPGVIGIKTGTTPAAGQNLVAAARRKGHRIIVVVLGSSDRYADATALLSYAVARDR
jgi:D-alanyl-D-alanine carboxypeptidase (penicillin-binding protein 5/6)